MMLEQEREKRRERKKHESHSDHHHQHHTSTHHHHHSNTSSALSHQSLSSSSSSNSMESSKLLYIRNLILQYLSCKDPILKEHMENAIITIFRYNEKEKQSIQLRKQDETSTDSLIYSSFASFVSNFSTT